MLSEPLFRLRLLGWIEGTTLLVLIGVAVPLEHLGGWPQGVSFMGPAHGFAFLVYLACVVETVASGGWTPVQAMRLVVVSLVPFGTFLNDRWLAARQVKSARHQRP